MPALGMSNIIINSTALSGNVPHEHVFLNKHKGIYEFEKVHP